MTWTPQYGVWGVIPPGIAETWSPIPMPPDFQDFLRVQNSNNGVDATLRTVTDGKGDPTPLRTSTTEIAIDATRATGGTVTRSLGARFADEINVLEYGADPTGVANSAPAFQAAINAAAGRKVVAPLGTYLFNSGITYSGPVHIEGQGMGAGPGAAQQDGACTRFLCNYASPQLFDITTNRPCIFRDFMIDVNPGFRPAADGFGIRVAGDTSINANTRIENVAFNNLRRGIVGFKPNWWTIKDCYFGGWGLDAIYFHTNTAWEGSGGYVINNYFFGDPAVTQRACITTECGYTVIQNNEILGAQYGVLVQVRNYPAGYIRVLDNTIEENFYAGVYVAAPDSFDMSMLEISRNEFSAVLTSATYFSSVMIEDGPSSRFWIDDVNVLGNTSRHVAACANGVIRIGAGRTVQVTNNTTENIGGGAMARMVIVNGVTHNSALGGEIIVADNIKRGTFTQVYEFAAISPGVTLRDAMPVTVAQLPTNTRDGSLAYASDGVPGSSPVASGGAGCAVIRQGSAWHAFAGATISSASNVVMARWNNPDASGAGGRASFYQGAGAEVNGVISRYTSGAWRVGLHHAGTARFETDNAGNLFMTVPGASYANDAAAATGGVPVGGIYRNGSVLQVRVA